MRNNSLLGRAIAAQRGWACDHADYVWVLDLLAESDQARPEWDRVVARCKPASELKFAGRLLHLVVMAAIESATAARRVGSGPGGRQGSADVERREDIEARYAALFGAVEVLEREFDGGARVRIVEPPTGEARRWPVSDEGAGLHWEEGDEALLLKVVAGWRAAGEDGPQPNDPVARAHFDYARFQRVVAPEFLRSLREHLGWRKAAALAVADEVPQSRNRGEGADRRAFVMLLDTRLQPLLGSQRVGFVAAMATIIFADQENVYSLEAAKQLIRRRAAKRGLASGD